MPFQSYTCGSINTIGRVAMTASIDLIVAQLILAMVAFNVPSYTVERWHTCLSYQALNVITLAYNLFALKQTPRTHNVGCKPNIEALLVRSFLDGDLTR